MDTALVKRWAELNDQAKFLDDESKRVKALRAEVEEQIIDAYVEEGITKMGVDGNTVFLRSDLRVSAAEGVSWDAIAPVLESIGLGDTLERKANLSTLAARFREWEREEEEIPEAVTKVLNIHRIPKLGIRRGKVASHPPSSK